MTENVGQLLGKGPQLVTKIGDKTRGNGANFGGPLRRTFQGIRRVTGSVVAGTGKLGKRATDTVEDVGKAEEKVAETIKERDHAKNAE